MTRLTRLQTYSRELAEAFRKAPHTKQLTAVLKSCRTAVLSTGLEREEINDALAALNERRSYSDPKGVQIIANELDYSYFDLYSKAGEVNTPDVLLMFRKARAASAVATALSDPDNPNVLEESLYEAINSVQDKKQIELIARTALEQIE